jgi:hypothetical protein
MGFRLWYRHDRKLDPRDCCAAPCEPIRQSPSPAEYPQPWQGRGMQCVLDLVADTHLNANMELAKIASAALKHAAEARQ